MVFDRWYCESLYAARLTEVVYYLSAGFLLLPACEPEHVPTQRGSLLPALDSCGVGTSRFRNSALTTIQSELVRMGTDWPLMAIYQQLRSGNPISAASVCISPFAVHVLKHQRPTVGAQGPAPEGVFDGSKVMRLIERNLGHRK